MMGSRSSSILSTVGSLVGIVDEAGLAVGGRDLVDHGGRAGDQLDLVLAFQPFLHDVHVQQSQETDAEAEAERRGHLGLVVQRRVVEA